MFYTFETGGTVGSNSTCTTINYTHELQKGKYGIQPTVVDARTALLSKCGVEDGFLLESSGQDEQVPRERRQSEE